MTKKKADVLKLKKKKLTVVERILLASLLPKEGTFVNLRLLRLAREALSFSEEENEGLQFRIETNAEGVQVTAWNTLKLTTEDGQVVKAPNDVLVAMLQKDPDQFGWKPACPEKEVFIGEIVEGIIVKTLQDLDKAGKLTEDHISLYEMFVKDNPGE